MSPILYSVDINDLAEDINALGAGINIDDDVNLAILLYADDVALIAPDENSLQRMLDVVNRWCRKWRMTLNGEKTKVLHLRNKTSPRSVFNFKCGDMKIDFDSSYRYLGLNFYEFMDY